MKTVTKEEFKNYFLDKWYTVHRGFFKGTKRFIIDGQYVGYKDEVNNIFKIAEKELNKWE